MPQTDFSQEKTEKILKTLEKQIEMVYNNARADMQKTVSDYFSKFQKRDSLLRRQLANGEISVKYYIQWRLAQIGRGRRYEKMRDDYAERMTRANEIAIDYINNLIPEIYCLNRNYTAYTIETQTGKGIDFTLYDEYTVRRLIKEKPDLMPFYPKEKALKRGFDLEYGKKQITKNITSSILQGAPVKKIADNLQRDIPTMNRNSAIRSARTAVTGAQNAGRLDGCISAENSGIKLKKQWLSTLDGRTRDSHARLDGEIVKNNKKFSNGCMFPGDPNGPPHEIYNCRCTLITVLDDVEISDAERRAKNPETGENAVARDLTYAEWVRQKQEQQAEQQAWLPKFPKKPAVATFKSTEGIDRDFAKGMAKTLKKSKYPEVKAVFAKYQSELKCVDCETKRNPFFSKTDGGVHINITEAMTGTRHQKPYQVAFHEFGHNIDWLMNGKNNFEYASNVAYDGIRLIDVIKGDYETFKKSVGISDNTALIDYMKKQNIPLKTRANISDVLEAMTGISYSLGVGHGAEYHKTPGATEREFFAEVLDSAAANQESFDQMQRLFPNAVKMVFDIIGGRI